MRRILIATLLLFSLPLFAQISKELIVLQTKYDQGALNEMADIMAGLRASNQDERALLSHFGAKLKKNKAEALSLHERALERFPKTLYGQLSALEAAKIYILDREYSKAKTALNKINSAQIPQRYYWLAVANFGLDEYEATISNSENFLRLSPNADLAENALHLITDVYIAQKKYHSAIQNLEKLRKLSNYDHQHYHYKLGTCHEASNKLNSAIAAYKEAYQVDKFSQIAYQVEERLFAFRDKDPSLDLSFLYPYSPLDLDAPATDFVAEAKDAASDNAPQIYDLNKQPLKLLSKPQQGIFLQAGRFSVESNAVRLSEKIREMQIAAAYFHELHQGKDTWVVLAGPFADRDAGAVARVSLTEAEINSFIVRY